MLHGIHVSATVVSPLLTLKSPTCTCISHSGNHVSDFCESGGFKFKISVIQEGLRLFKGQRSKIGQNRSRGVGRGAKIGRLIILDFFPFFFPRVTFVYIANIVCISSFCFKLK